MTTSEPDRKDIKRVEDKLDKLSNTMTTEIRVLSTEIASMSERLKGHNELYQLHLVKLDDSIKIIHESTNDLIDEVDSMQKENVPAKLENHDRRLTSLEGDRHKIVWLIVAAVLTAVLALILK